MSEMTPNYLNVACQVSGMPIVRSTATGVFCNAAVCTCEQKLGVVLDDPIDYDILEGMMSPEAEAALEEQCKLWFYEKGLE